MKCHLLHFAGSILLCAACMCLLSCGYAANDAQSDQDAWNAAAKTGDLPGQTVTSDADTICVEQDVPLETLLAVFSKMPNLQEADISVCQLQNAELTSLMQAYPRVAFHYAVTVNGQRIDHAERSITLNDGWNGEDTLAGLIDTLPLLTKVEHVDLTGWEQQEDTQHTLPLTALAGLMEQFPQITFGYTFSAFGRAISTEAERLDLYSASIGDTDVDTLREVLRCLPQCTFVDLGQNPIDDELLAQLQTEFPSVTISRIVYFGVYCCRTDANMLKASSGIKSQRLSSQMADVLKNCTELEYLDLGHNDFSDVSFIANMPKLRVLILAISHHITDITPLANCKQLEYLELFTNRVSDITPLAGLTELRHLNLCNNPISDATPLYGLKNLERLWIAGTQLSQTQLEELQKQLPNCVINATTLNPTAERWRKGERYELLCEQFHYGSGINYIRFDPYEQG